MRRPLAFAFCLSVLFAPGSALGYAQKYYQSSYYSQSYYQSYYQAAYSSGSGGTPNRDYRIFTYTGSTQSFTVPNGVTSLNVVVVGGGGGGGGGANQWGSGAGGGCGGGVRGQTLSVTPGQVISVTVGAGGAGGPGQAANGASGGSSSFGSITAAGGGWGRNGYYNLYGNYAGGSGGGSGGGGGGNGWPGFYRLNAPGGKGGNLAPNNYETAGGYCTGAAWSGTLSSLITAVSFATGDGGYAPGGNSYYGGGGGGGLVINGSTVNGGNGAQSPNNGGKGYGGGGGGSNHDGPNGGSGAPGVVYVEWAAYPASCAVSFSSSTINQGQSATLSWSVSNAQPGTNGDTMYIDNVGYVTGTAGSFSVSPSATTNYRCQASGIGGSNGWHNATLTVRPLPTITFTASDSEISQGDSTVLTWSTTNANSCTSSSFSTGGGSGGSQSYTTPGTYSFTVPAFGTLTVTLNGAGGGGGGGGQGGQVNEIAGCPDGTCYEGPEGSNGSSGSAGGSSSFSSVSASGGSGGTGGEGGQVSYAYTGAGDSGSAGAGGTASGGDTNTTSGGSNGGSGGSGGAGTCSVCQENTNWVNVGAGAVGGTGGAGGKGGKAVKTYSSGQLMPGAGVTVTVGAGGAGGGGGGDYGNGAGTPGSAGSAGSAGSVAITWTSAPSTSGSVSVSPDDTTTYAISCAGDGGTAHASTTVSVSHEPCILGGVTVEHGESHTFYSTQTAPPGQTCTGSGGGTDYSQVRTCTDGTLSGSSAYQYASCSCSATYSCSGNTVTYTNAACSTTSVISCTSPQYCSPGVSSCVSPEPVFEEFGGGFSGHLEAKPLLVPRGISTRLYWNVSNVNSCTVVGDNGDSWTGLTSGSSGKLTLPLTARTIFTLSCDAYEGATFSDESVTVNLVPIFNEN